MEQAEQLWSASARIGPEASPILLFYGLTQAGRAICAAHLRGDRWKPLHGHGLSFNMAEPAQNVVPGLFSVVVTPTRDGHVHQVAEALNSPVLAKPTALADLLAALDIELFFDHEDLPGRRPLRVSENGMSLWVPRTPVGKSLYVRPLPDDLAKDTIDVQASPGNLAYTRPHPPSRAQVADWLARYPRLSALGAPDTIGDPEPAGLGRRETGWAIRLGWDGPVYSAPSNSPRAVAVWFIRCPLSARASRPSCVPPGRSPLAAQPSCAGRATANNCCPREGGM